jgi:5-methylcytosine-specific restriction endonuclease McrA
MSVATEEGTSRFHRSTVVPAYLPEGLLFSHLSDRAKVTYAALGRFGDLDIDSTDERLAEDLHCTADDVEEALAALEHGGWVLRAGDDVFLLSGTADEHICGGGRSSSECPACVALERELMWLQRPRVDLRATPKAPSVRVAKRKQKIPAELRRAVFERDAYRCRECGTHLDLTVDHIYPESLGGPTTLENLQTLCRPHNSSKAVKVLDAP